MPLLHFDIHDSLFNIRYFLIIMFLLQRKISLCSLFTTLINGSTSHGKAERIIHLLDAGSLASVPMISYRDCGQA
jgi:hypothetical protein